MKKLNSLIKLWLKSTFCLLTIFAFTNNQIYAQSDTLFPTGVINSINDVEVDPINFPLQFGEPVGDVNGDGFVDFVFTKYTWNELTEEYTDKVWKSAIVTNIDKPKSAFVIYDAEVQGIGDYNGDGYDDMIDINQERIYFGNALGEEFDTIGIGLFENSEKVYFYEDITGDGKSDLIIGEESTSITDSVFVFSFEHSSPIHLPVNFNWGFTQIPLMFNYYDYDNDDEKELLAVAYEFGNYNYGWFTYNSDSNEFILENENFLTSSTEPNYSFAKAISDINGDGLEDICHVFYDEGLHLEVCFGKSTPPYYFDFPVQIQMFNDNRLLYNAGDINNDGADDWYSKEVLDSIVVYYGNAEVADSGFIKMSYFTGNENLLMPLTRFYGTYHLAGEPLLLDYNKDDFFDLMFNFWSFDNNQEYDTLGMAIYSGSTQPDFSSARILGTSKADAYIENGFGGKIENIGDFNKDGYDDWAILSTIGCYLNIYYGGEIIDYEVDRQILLPNYPYVESRDMAFGDLNDDGWVDVAVSSSTESEIRFISNLLEEKQNIYVYFGSEDMPDQLHSTDADLVLKDSTTFYSFGKNISIPCDYNADGFNDLVVGGELNKKSKGTAFIYYGGEQVSDSPDMTINVNESTFGAIFASPITSCGDINNDGFNDMVLGDGSNTPGQALVYFGGPDADELFDVSLINPISSGSQFGYASPTVEGDFDFDGYPDIIEWNNSGNLIHVYRGGPDFDQFSDIKLADPKLLGINRYIQYIKDFSEKGKSDIFISTRYNSTGLFLLFFGTNSNKYSADMVFKNNFGYPGGIASGDFDKDGFTDVFVGMPAYPIDGWVNGGVVQHYRSPVLVGVEEKDSNNNFEVKLLPNPTTSQLQIDCKTDSPENIDISILNLGGKVVKEIRAESNTKITIELGKLPAGLYFVNVKSDSFSQSSKVVKL